MQEMAPLSMRLCLQRLKVTCPALQDSIRKKLDDNKRERNQSQANEDVRALREEISELRSAARSQCLLALSPAQTAPQCSA